MKNEGRVKVWRQLLTLSVAGVGAVGSALVSVLWAGAVQSDAQKAIFALGWAIEAGLLMTAAWAVNQVFTGTKEGE